MMAPRSRNAAAPSTQTYKGHSALSPQIAAETRAQQNTVVIKTRVSSTKWPLKNCKRQLQLLIPHLKIAGDI